VRDNDKLVRSTQERIIATVLCLRPYILLGTGVPFHTALLGNQPVVQSRLSLVEALFTFH